jgi:hypothetical protein
MKKINKLKNFESFNEGFGKLSNYLNRIWKRGGEFANNVWDATKVEGKETKIAVEILGRMLKGEEVTDREKEFVKRQSKDIVRILPLVAISGLPIPIPITPLLVMLGKKYGFDFLPKDHRGILENSIELTDELKSTLDNIPETGMGYHIVDVLLKNGRVLKGRTVVNSSKLVLNSNEEVKVEDIEDIFSE